MGKREGKQGGNGKINREREKINREKGEINRERGNKQRKRGNKRGWGWVGGINRGNGK